jgi:hypothetical protein
MVKAQIICKNINTRHSLTDILEIYVEEESRIASEYSRASTTNFEIANRTSYFES